MSNSDVVNDELLEKLSQKVKTAITVQEKKVAWFEVQQIKLGTDTNLSVDALQKIQVLEKDLHIQSKKAPINIGGLIRALGVLLAFIMLFPFFVLISPIRKLEAFLKRRFHINVKPLQTILRYFGRYIITLFCVEIHMEGLENLNEFLYSGSPIFGLFQHLSNLDSFTIVAGSPIGFTWVGKESLLKVPIFGQITRIFGTMVGIDRKDRESAINNLNKLCERLRKQGISIAIAPEGTRSTTGQLMEFKKGPFHMAVACQVPIVPIILFGHYDLWPPHQLLPSPGSVTLRFLPYVNPPPPPSLPLKSSTEDADAKDAHDELLVKIRKIMLSETVKPPCIEPSTSVSWSYLLLHFVTLLLTYVLFYYLVGFLYNSNTITYIFGFVMALWVTSGDL